MKSELLCVAIICLPWAAWAKGISSPPDQDEEPKAYLSLDSSLDASTKRDVFATTSVTVSPFGDLDTSGIRVRLEGTFGRYQYKNEDPPPLIVGGRSVDTTMSFGYEAVFDNSSIAGYIGWNSQTNRLSVDDPENPTSGTKMGIKAALEFSTQPTPNTSLEASASLASANRAYRMSVKAGYKIGEDMYFGPQLIAQGDEHYTQRKLGAFVSGLKLGRVDLELGAGFLHDQKQGNGQYITVSTGLRF